MKNNLIIALFIFLIGIIVGRVTAPVENLNEHFKEKITYLHDNELKTYADATNVDEKLKAAQALYEKMMILFLADLSLNLAHFENKAVHDQKESATPETKKDLDVTYNSESGQFEKNSITVSSEDSKSSTSTQDSAKKTLSENSPPEEVLFEYLKSKPAKKIDKKIENFLGTMTGTLKYIEGKFKNETHSVQMEMNFTITDKELQGNSLVELRDTQGHPYSTSRGNGGNNSLKLSENNPDFLYIETSPDSFFMINLKTYPQFTGSYFQRDKKIGFIQLQKSE